MTTFDCALWTERVAELQQHYSRLKERRFNVSREYIDQATAFGLGRDVDYDPRVPMAGKSGGRPAGATKALPERPPVDFVFSPRFYTNVPPGKPIDAGVIATVAERCIDRPVSMRVTAGRDSQTALTLRGGQLRRGNVALPYPKDDDAPITVVGKIGDHEVRRQYNLSVLAEANVLIDLMSSQFQPTWGYQRRGGEEVRPATRRGPGYTRFVPSYGSCGGVRRPAFAAPPAFGKPPHGMVFGEFNLQLPQNAVDLAFGIGINETTVSADGVVFRIVLTDENGQAHELFEAHHGNGPWRNERISLKRFAGQWVTLRFETDCGPNDDASADAARWAEPRVLPHASLEISEFDAEQ